MSQDTMPLRERIAALVDPVSWAGWESVRRWTIKTALDADPSRNMEELEQLAKVTADNWHGAGKVKSLETADTVLTLFHDGLRTIMDEAPTPADLTRHGGLERYRLWHEKFVALEAFASAFAVDRPQPDAPEPDACHG